MIYYTSDYKLINGDALPNYNKAHFQKSIISQSYKRGINGSGLVRQKLMENGSTSSFLKKKRV